MEENMPIFVKFILLIEAALFLFFVFALTVKILERIKEARKDKYRDIEK